MPKKKGGGKGGKGDKPKKAPVPLPPIEVPPVEEDPEVIRAREAEQARTKRVYAAGIKSTLDLQPTSPRPIPNKGLVDTFTSPFLREQFGLVKLLDHGWPAVERGSPSPRNLPELATSTSHTSLPGTMLAPPLVPRPLSHHSSRVVPRPRPASRAERAHGRTWQQRHHSLAARSVGAFEGCARAIDSPDADTRFRRSLQALRQNRFHFAVAADPDEPSPPPTPQPLPELPEQWEAVLLAATDDWGDMATHDALHHGRRQTERDRMREPDPSRPLPSVAEVRAQGGGFNFNELLMLLQATHLVGPELSPGDACALYCRLGGMASGALAPHVSAANKETPIVFDAWIRFFVALAEMLLPDVGSPGRVEHVFSYLIVHTRLHQGRPLGDDSDLAAAADEAEPATTPNTESAQHASGPTEAEREPGEADDAAEGASGEASRPQSAGGDSACSWGSDDD